MATVITYQTISTDLVKELKSKAKQAGLKVTFSKGTCTKAVRGSINIRFNPTAMNTEETYAVAQQIADFCNENRLAGYGHKTVTKYDCSQSGAWYLFQIVD